MTTMMIIIINTWLFKSLTQKCPSCRR